ncbi:MAG: valine--pyruvate transaminase [Chromatocurvus sp.]
MKLSVFGEKFSARSGVVDLMRDLGDALHDNPDMLFMGGGNPARLPAVESVYRDRLRALLDDPGQWQRLAGSYQSPGGDRGFREALATYLQQRYGWSVGPDNIAVTNGSQSAYFVLYNLFAGQMPDGSHRRIHLPVSPEYIGYADAGISDDFFSATAPRIELTGAHEFEYRLDKTSLDIDENVGALCVSRPTNPSGNVLDAEELATLEALAAARDIPLIVDGAYGAPFPDITFTESEPRWNERTILTLSLSKLGLPGLRTGIIVAREDVVAAFNSTNTIINLASGAVGPALAENLIRSGALHALTDTAIRPFYRERMQHAVATAQSAFAGLPYRLHRPQGAFFLWCWFEGLPISSADLYERLKRAGVLAIPGERFFIGLDPVWTHTHECIRLSYAQDPSVVEAGLALVAREVRHAFDAG